ncbi:hypothetical protein Cs7R123_38020 [Catellatospora sp. TT07R-123]|uniref:hypothetical protein n=1 Tax=Catellatospora sp. TT07R-123 TaxID=2733863 RepID=UPI001AFDEBA8|nr:hypothetical protein [Catellatospora sp. TT07R-123]GHJ46460.1 hypothetical protein Cs7R123_38020 [Catellatospora sp. TT07R-123]
MERRSVWRKVLLGLVIVLAVGGIGAAVATLTAYHEATKIDRSVPEVVVAEYLRAALQNKDEVGVDLYTCQDPSALAPMSALIDELAKREHDFGVQVIISWGALNRADQSGQVRIQTDLTVTAIKDGAEESSSQQRWQFGLVEEDGWRVCAAEQGPMPSASPTPSPSIAA